MGAPKVTLLHCHERPLNVQLWKHRDATCLTCVDDQRSTLNIKVSFHRLEILGPMVPARHILRSRFDVGAKVAMSDLPVVVASASAVLDQPCDFLRELT